MLEKYFERKRLSATVLRRRYPLYLKLFRMDNFTQVYHMAINHELKKRKSFRVCVELQFPSQAVIDMYIHDQAQKIAIKHIVENVFAECDKHDERWQHLDNASFNRKYPFIQNGVTMIKKIVGISMFEEMKIKSIECCFQWTIFVGVQHLCMQIEGRKCAYSACSNQESRDDGMIEKYKMCSVCRGAFYCSKRCQKRDWKEGHKHKCFPNIIYNTKYGTPADLLSISKLFNPCVI